jgi:DnaK suppressor protein
MSDLTEEQLLQLKTQLNERERALRDELQGETNEKDEYLDVATEVPDPGDASFANLAVDLGNAAVTRDLVELRAIEAAYARMDAGSYGECVDCETEIPFERLNVQPTAERCAPCQEMYEKTHATQVRGATM